MLAGAAACALCGPLRAQRSAKVARVGFLGPAVPDDDGRELFGGFRAEMEQLGWTEGSRVQYVVRLPGPTTTEAATRSRIASAVQELIAAKVDVIVVLSTRCAIVAKSATATIPIVFLADKPVENKLVASLARPGGNASGVAFHAEALSAKRIQLLKEAFPAIRRVAFLVPGSAASLQDFRAARAAVEGLDIELSVVAVESVDDLERVFAATPRPDAWVIEGYSTFVPVYQRIIELVAASRRPAIYADPDWVRSGGLMSYSDERVSWSQPVARYADRILRGARPAELPVEQPSRFTLAVNRKTARALGLTIAPSVLLQADDVID